MRLDNATGAAMTAANGCWTVGDCYAPSINPEDPDDDLNLNSSVDFSRRDAEAQRMLDICVVLSFRPKQDGFANLHLVGEKH